jgi:zinc transport system ATP-binding protein
MQKVKKMITDTIISEERDEIKKNNPPLICIKDLDVAYQNVIALIDINLDIYPNELIGICGPNASGKSTLLKAILRLVNPVHGQIRIFDCNTPNKTIEKLNIGYVPQLQTIDRNFPALVYDVVAMGRYKEVGFFKRVKKNDRYVEDALRAVGMWKFRERPIGHLSGGQQQKVMIARALSSNPDVLLLDEPTAALDFKIQKSIMDLIKELHEKQNLTILLVTHNMTFLKEFPTRVICLNKRIIWQGKPSDPKLESIINQIFFQ